MSKRILILTAGKGGGHRNSSDAIESEILRLDPTAEVNAVDALSFFPGYTGDETGYISLTTRYRLFWKCFFEVTSFFKGISNRVLARPIYRPCQALIRDYQPDLILSVHPCFVGSVDICLKRMKSTIPLYTCIIDLVKHSRLWYDTSCATTFVPTREMYELLLKRGFSRQRLVHSGFPIGQRYDRKNKLPATLGALPNILMVSPSLKGQRATLELIRAATEHEAELCVVTGSNRKLRKFLDEELGSAPNVTITGYVSDMDRRLARADVLIAKAGPNNILEAVRMCVPVLITGHIPGQEEKNHRYIVEHGYGLRCDSPEKLRRALERVFANDRELLEEFSRNEQDCPDVFGATVVAQRLLDALGDTNTQVGYTG